MYEQEFQTIDKQDFLTKYWQKQPCVFRKAFNNYPNYLSADELAGLSLEPEIESRLIQFEPTTNKWSLEHGPLPEQTFSTLSNSHWTLLVQSVDSWVPATRELIKAFNCIPKWRFDDLMVSYATDQGGVGPHFDNFDVFLIQGLGKRLWKVGEPGKIAKPFEITTGLSQIAPFDSLIQVELDPGDMLYIPPKTAHWGVSIGESIGYSVGYRSPETRQLITLLAEHLQETSHLSDFFQDQYRASPSHHNQFDPQLREWAQQQLQQLANQPDLLEQLLCRQLSYSKFGFQPDENTNNIQELSIHSTIQLNDQLSIIWRVEGEKIILSIEGEEFNFEKYLITAIKKLANFEVCSINLFKKSPNSVDFPSELSNLVNRGYVNIVN